MRIVILWIATMFIGCATLEKGENILVLSNGRIRYNLKIEREDKNRRLHKCFLHT